MQSSKLAASARLFLCACGRHYNPGNRKKRWIWHVNCAEWNMKRKVIELVRVSTEGQASEDKASIPAQKAVNRRTCVQYDLEIVGTIQISDVSGASVLRTPEMAELLQRIESPDIHGVVAREFSRLMRPENFSDYALLQAFVETGTVLYLPEGPIDLSTKTGRLMGTIRAAIAGMERGEILERIWTAKEEKRRRGQLAQSANVLPFGVGYEEGQGFYYKPEARLVQEAFRCVLSGNHSYSKLAKSLGVTPRGMHLILRNPIYTGWRVIDKKRDPSAKGRYSKEHGRQADRRKIQRAPDEVIRVRVIQDPLISDEEFQAVQRTMDLKTAKHWRSQPDLQHRFTYNGFLVCALCGAVIHTALARRDYYACKGRRVSHRCDAGYMGREKLEARIDYLLSRQLTDPSFLQRCAETLTRRCQDVRPPATQERLRAELNRLSQKRERILDSFYEGVLDREARNRRLSKVDEEIQTAQQNLASEHPPVPVDSKALLEAFAPLAEWEYWTRAQKRAVLAALAPEIRVANYEVESLGLNPELFSNEHTRTGTDSSQPPT
jgi:DNA invertase Pin-like site-specific DNA recombinase